MPSRKRTARTKPTAPKKSGAGVQRFEVKLNDRQWSTLFNLTQGVMESKAAYESMQNRMQTYVQNSMDSEGIPLEFSGVTVDAERHVIVFCKPEDMPKEAQGGKPSAPNPS